MSDADDVLSPDAFGAPDPDEQPGGRRRRGVLVATVAAVALIAGLLVWQPWSSDEATTPTTTAPVLPSELVIDVDGLTLARSLQSSGAFDSEQAQDGFIFAAPGATLEAGPYLAFLVNDLVDGDEIGSGDSDTTIVINGHDAVVEDNDGNIEVYWEGEPGVRYGVAGAGVTRAQVIAFAEAISFDGGVTTVNDPDAIDGLEPAGDIGTLFGILSMAVPFFSPDPDSTTLEYSTERGDTITLASVEATGDISALAALVLDDERLIEIDGEQVVIGVVDDSFSAEGDLQILLAMRGGRLIGITGTNIDDDGLLALLAGVRPATDDEWAEVLAVVEDPMGDFLGNDEGGEDLAAEVTVADTALPDETEP